MSESSLYGTARRQRLMSVLTEQPTTNSPSDRSSNQGLTTEGHDVAPPIGEAGDNRDVDEPQHRLLFTEEPSLEKSIPGCTATGAPGCADVVHPDSSVLKVHPTGLAPVDSCLVATQSQLDSEVAKRHANHRDKPDGVLQQTDRQDEPQAIAMSDADRSSGESISAATGSRGTSPPLLQSSPSIQSSRGRASLVVTLFGMAWMVLALRLLQLQWWQQDRLSDRAERQREYSEEIVARPGDIIDRQGRLVATTLTARSLYVVPNRIEQAWTMAQSLARALDTDADAIFERIGERSDRHFLWIKRRLSDEEVEAIKHLELPKGTWGFRDEYRRVYPQGVAAAHVLGLRDIDGVGRGGVEEALNGVLSGKNGKRPMVRDSRGRVIEVLDEVDEPSHPGETVRLSLDLVVQLFAERELDAVMSEWKPESCCAIVLEPETGDVLAMASRPTFDPNHPELAVEAAWKNRTISDIYEPGSTFKPFLVGYGLDQDLIERDDVFHCEHGQYRMGRRLLHDHHPYGKLSLTDVLVKSSNIGMAKIGERLTNKGLHEAATLFGFGRKTGIELPGEQPGILRPLSEWTSYSTGSIPMGHEVATTPLQLIVGHAALAARGKLPRPRIVLPEGNDSLASLRQMTSDTIREETARWLIEHPMQEVVTRGTGKKARVPGYNVFGKTGTAQTMSPTGGYVHGKYISSFICGAPVEEPRLLVLVVVNQSSVGGETFGGKVAAPAAANILKQSLVYLRISPDEHLLRTTRQQNDETDVE